MKTIDVVILTMNKGKNILPLLDLLNKQIYVPNKIIIMNTLNDEKDVSCLNELFDKFDKLNIEEHIVYKKNFSHGSTRKEAAKYSNANYILYMTDDCVPYDDNLLKSLYNKMQKDYDLYKDYNIAMSYARQLPKKNCRYCEKLVREYNYPNYDIIKNKETLDKYGIKNYFASNVCCMYDRNILISLGGFEESVDFNEDELFAYKCINKGYSVLYNSEAKVYHSHNLSLIEQYKRNFLIGSSQKQYKEIFGNLKNESEGKKLVKFISIQAIKELKFLELIYFYIECVFRYKGFLDGKNNK